MLEEKNDNLSPSENETDGALENVSENETQEVVEENLEKENPGAEEEVAKVTEVE